MKNDFFKEEKHKEYKEHKEHKHKEENYLKEGIQVGLGLIGLGIGLKVLKDGLK